LYASTQLVEFYSLSFSFFGGFNGVVLTLESGRPKGKVSEANGLSL
jgi:hypothetical protein